jgi:hypothetical protein
MRRIASPSAFALPVILVLLLAAPPAPATTTQPKEVRCPVCAKTITVLTISSTNSAGGPDFDLCIHAAGEEPRTLRLWTCPHCLHTQWGGDFEKEVPEELARKVREELKPPCPIDPGADQRKIPAWAKYRLALTIAAWREATAEELAQLALEGAFATRADSYEDEFQEGGRPEEVTALLRDLAARAEADVAEVSPVFRACRIHLRVADLLVEGVATLPADSGERSLRVLLAASFRRLRGEDAPVAPLLAALAADASAPARYREAARELLASAARQREFLAEFLKHSERALAEKPADEEFRALLPWFRAEALRRTGRTEEAAAACEAVMTSSSTPPFLSAMLPELIAAVGGAAISPERRAEIDRKWREGALARLVDPESAKDAYRELRARTDPLAVPVIVAALKHESPVVREYAALTLKFYDDPGPEAVDALLDLVAREAEGTPREKAEYALREICSPRCRAWYEKTLAVEALGCIGTGETVALLTPRLAADPRTVLAALARLANRAFESPEDFSTWHGEHGKETRAEWVRAGFREAGYEIDDLAADAAVPLLLSALADERDPIRWNAFRALREKTGLSIAREAFTRQRPRDLAAAVARWRRHFGQ